MNTLATKARVKLIDTLARASRFEKLVAEALTTYRELTSLPSGKLSAKAYLAEACRNGKTTVEKLKKLEIDLGKLPESDRKLIDAFLAGARHAIQSICLDPPVGRLDTLLPSRDNNDFVMLLVQAMMAGTTALELVALATWQVTQSHPECFGTVEEPLADLAERRRELQARYDAAIKAIEDGTTLADLHHEWIGAGTAKMSYRWNGADTGISADDPGALVTWLAANE